MSRILKKFQLQYDYLSLEKEEIEEKIEGWHEDWNALFGRYFAEHNAEMYQNEETGELRNKPPEEEEKPKKSKKDPHPKIKKLYRKLSTKLHPDKGGDSDKFDELKKAYEKEDLIKLYKIAGNNNVEFDVTEEDEELLRNSITKLAKSIEGAQKSLIWAYFNGDVNTKKVVVKNIETALNIEIDPENLPEELRN